MDKIDILSMINFGKSIAEEEFGELGNYFVKTDLWKRIFQGEIDVVYGPKGSGKSALYSILLNSKETLLSKNIIAEPAEKLKGTPIFKRIEQSLSLDEEQYINLWKLYFLSLIGKVIKSNDSITCDNSKILIRKLEEERLLDRSFNLASLLADVLSYIKSLAKIQALEGTVKLNEATGNVNGFAGKIIFSEPTKAQNINGCTSINKLFEYANSALLEHDMNIWILLDRLDVAFTNHEEEKNALRALFRTYNDLKEYEQISLKIFMRSDIWNDITDEGFREASHIEDSINIEWDEQSLFNLIVRRILNNNILCENYSINMDEVLRDRQRQEDIFYKVFPLQVESNVSNTFKWILSRIKDGKGYSAPREIIQLLNNARNEEIKRIELAQINDDKSLISRSALRSALKEVSKNKIHKTIYAEYPDVKEYIEKLRKEKATQRISTLAKIWNTDTTTTAAIIDRLLKIGFFEAIGEKSSPEFRIPFLFRDELGLVQGSAE